MNISWRTKSGATQSRGITVLDVKLTCRTHGCWNSPRFRMDRCHTPQCLPSRSVPEIQAHIRTDTYRPLTCRRRRCDRVMKHNDPDVRIDILKQKEWDVKTLKRPLISLPLTTRRVQVPDGTRKPKRICPVLFRTYDFSNESFCNNHTQGAHKQ